MSNHPLDRTDDDEEPAFDYSSVGSQQVTVYKPLLRFCVRSLIGLSLLVFLAAIATNNTSYGTSQWKFAIGVYRALNVMLLLAFVGVLAAYRLPKLLKSRSKP